MKREAKPAAFDAALLDEHRYRALDRRRRNDEALPARAQRQHPEQPAVRGDDAAAVIAGAEPAIEDDAVIDGTARETLPGRTDGAHDAKLRRNASLRAECESKRAYARHRESGKGAREFAFE